MTPLAHCVGNQTIIDTGYVTSDEPEEPHHMTWKRSSQLGSNFALLSTNMLAQPNGVTSHTRLSEGRQRGGGPHSETVHEAQAAKGQVQSHESAAEHSSRWDPTNHAAGRYPHKKLACGSRRAWYPCHDGQGAFPIERLRARRGTSEPCTMYDANEHREAWRNPESRVKKAGGSHPCPCNIRLAYSVGCRQVEG